ncbi:hypothetical protein, conserved [Plasmodium ovale wallikeri]|uniref:Uncharacterized protein n=1 Tax=Plasmodium ovale wallikeri TaxID=864142 RepID=A0A1A8YQ21_PLAOA|nr:hypothetical protein, conserved [Plasmodium ovale wallikeri]SBT56711.1 hypothetical protein, conserved [Plasmodium ovale wallikeri]
MLPYVPYMYKCTKITILKKFYDHVRPKRYPDLVHFAKGLYLYLCKRPNGNDDSFITFAKKLFSDISQVQVFEKDKKDICLFILLYIKCKKGCRTFSLEDTAIKYIIVSIEENLDNFDEEDLSTVLTFLYSTGKHKLYAISGDENSRRKRVWKDKISVRITNKIIARSTNYLHHFNQTKNLCILYSYLCRENITIHLHNKVLQRILANFDKCEDTDLTNIIFNFYHINSFFFNKFLRKICEFFTYGEREKNSNTKCRYHFGVTIIDSDKGIGAVDNGDSKGDIPHIGCNINKEKCKGRSEEKNSYITTDKEDSNFFLNAHYMKWKNDDDQNGSSSGQEERFDDITYRNLFNIYNCNIYVYRYINNYNDLFFKRKIIRLKDQCNFIDNIWKNCRLLYGFYLHFDNYLHRNGKCYDMGIENLLEGDGKKNNPLLIKGTNLYSDIFSQENLRAFIYIYKNGINYHKRYFNWCRKFLCTYILDILRTRCTAGGRSPNVRRENFRHGDDHHGDDNDGGISERVNSSHVYILLNALCQMNVHNEAIYSLIMENFKRKQSTYSLKATLLLLHFSLSHSKSECLKCIYKNVDKIINELIGQDSTFIPSNYGIIFLPPFLSTERIYSMYRNIFLKCSIYYLKKKKYIQTYKLNDDLFFFGLCYNILTCEEKNEIFLKRFSVKYLRKIYKFFHNFENITKKNFLHLKKTKTREKMHNSNNSSNNNNSNNNSNNSNNNNNNNSNNNNNNMNHNNNNNNNNNSNSNSNSNNSNNYHYYHYYYYYYFEDSNNINALLDYVEFSMSQNKPIYLSFLNFFKMHQDYYHVYANYGHRYLIPSLAPSIITSSVEGVPVMH